MVKVLCTFWALILHVSGIYIFQTCCENSVEDDHDQYILVPNIPALLFASGVYIALAHVSLLPQSFQKPIAPILCLYELISTIFIMEFFVGCIWSPLNVFILSTLPKSISHVLHHIDEHEIALWVETYSHPALMALVYIISVGFLGITLHISNALDFTIFTEYGLLVFLDCAIYRLWKRILSELPSYNKALNDCAARRNPDRPPRRPRVRRRFRECDCPDVLVVE